ncbi:MAG: efflux transporter outer membrane subunit [Candidatus Eisenbacteria bacterium]
MMLRLLPPFLIVAILVVGIMAGCAIGPAYHRPALEAPGSWPHADSTFYADTTTVRSEISWWRSFGDSVLAQLIETGLQENTDVRIAAAKVEELMGRYGVAKSDFYPRPVLTGSVARQQLIPGELSRGEPEARDHFEVDLGATWEIDLWGRLRRASEAARADLLASEEARRGVVLTTVALIASSYIDLLALDAQLAIARETVEGRRSALDLFEMRRERGDLSDLVFSQAESEYWLAASQIPLIEKNIVFVENRINYLLGRNPGPVARGMLLDDLRLPEVSAGLASDLLDRRPDVRFAEEQLRGANARIGVAKSLYFPTISLSGFLGYASDELSSLFSDDTKTWSIGADAYQLVFPFLEVGGQVKAAEGLHEQALYSYVQTVRNAFRETENALVDRGRTGAQARAEASRVAALATYVRLARMRYDEGVTSYLEVLDAERALFATELDYTQTKAEMYKSVVAIYEALAGSWLDEAAAASFRIEEDIAPRDR